MLWYELPQFFPSPAPQSLSPDFGGLSKYSNYNWYHHHLHVPQLFQFSDKIQEFIVSFTFILFHGHLGSSVSSAEKDIDTRLTKAWTAIDRLSIIWKSDLTDKMKRGFFQAAVVSILLYGCTTWTLTPGEEARRQLHKNAASNIEQVRAATPNKAPTIWPPASHHENYPS